MYVSECVIDIVVLLMMMLARPPVSTGHAHLSVCVYEDGGERHVRGQVSGRCESAVTSLLTLCLETLYQCCYFTPLVLDRLWCEIECEIEACETMAHH